MKYFKLFILLLLITSCKKKEVQLPKIGEKGITKIQNNSNIWFFYDKINNDTVANYNKNNKISNTHLIFNIDKRLPLKEVLPKIHELQEKLKEDSPHKSEGKRNYYSYADTLSNTFALYDFTYTNYIFTKKDYENKISEIINEKKQYPIFIRFNKESISVNDKKSDDFIKTLKSIKANDTIKNRTLFLSFDKNLTYKKYLTVKTKLLSKGYKVEDDEYIFNEE